GGEGGEGGGEPAVGKARNGALRPLEDEWNEREEADGRENRARHEQEAVAGVAPVQDEPGGGEGAVEDRGPRGGVPDRKDRRRQCDGEARPWVEPAGHGRGGDERGDQYGRPEGEERRTEERGDDREPDRQRTPRVALRGSKRLVVRLLRAPLPLRARLWPAQGVAELGREVGR